MSFKEHPENTNQIIPSFLQDLEPGSTWDRKSLIFLKKVPCQMIIKHRPGDDFLRPEQAVKSRKLLELHHFLLFSPTAIRQT